MRVLITSSIFLLCGSVFAAESSNKSKSPRLKFKDGPVCMCSEGLTEKDIRAAMESEKAADEKDSATNSQQIEASRNRGTED